MAAAKAWYHLWRISAYNVWRMACMCGVAISQCSIVARVTMLKTAAAVWHVYQHRANAAIA